MNATRKQINYITLLLDKANLTPEDLGWKLESLNIKEASIIISNILNDPSYLRETAFAKISSEACYEERMKREAERHVPLTGAILNVKPYFF